MRSLTMVRIARNLIKLPRPNIFNNLFNYIVWKWKKKYHTQTEFHPSEQLFRLYLGTARAMYAYVVHRYEIIFYLCSSMCKIVIHVPCSNKYFMKAWHWNTVWKQAFTCNSKFIINCEYLSITDRKWTLKILIWLGFEIVSLSILK